MNGAQFLQTCGIIRFQWSPVDARRAFVLVADPTNPATGSSEVGPRFAVLEQCDLADAGPTKANCRSIFGLAPPTVVVFHNVAVAR